MGGPYREPGVPNKNRHFEPGQHVRISDPNVPTPFGVVVGRDTLKPGNWLVMSLVGMSNIYTVPAEKMEVTR